MIQIFKKLMRNQVFVGCLIIGFALITGASILGVTHNVQALEDKGIELGCYFGGQNGNFCGSDGDCNSGNCVGGDGSCVSGFLGTCQPVPPACTDADLQCNSNADCTPITGPNSMCNFSTDPFSGCQVSQCVPEVCTTESPQPPSSFEASFTDPNTLLITIPASPQNGGGDTHNVRVVLATQDINAVQGQFALVDQSNISLSTGQVMLSYSISWPSPQGSQPVKVGIRNYDNCQDIYGSWKIVSPVVPPVDPSTIPACTGAVPPDSVICSGDDAGITVNTPWTTVPACSNPAGSAPKCERICINGTVPQNGLCVYPPETGNVFGWAWSSNIGWIKMNSCEDVNPFDGIADAGCVPQFGVKVGSSASQNPPTGSMSGHAWSPSIGWVSFGGNISGFIPGTSAPGTIPVASFMANASPASTVARVVRGWARSLTAMPPASGDQATPGWDGWVSFSDNANLGLYPGHVPLYPTGEAYIDGSAGVTYHIPTAKIVGFAWAGDVLGWVKFSGDNYQTTYGAPSSFDYSLSRSPSGTIAMQGGDSEVVSITRTLTGGVTQPVTVSSAVVTLPGGAPTTGATVSISNGNNPCSPNCSSNITITGVTSGQYIVTVTTTSAGIANKTIDIPVTVDAPSGVVPVVTCTIEESSPFIVNQPVTWRATASGGEPGVPYTFLWSGSDGLACSANQPCQTISGAAGEISEVKKTYETTGNKTVQVSVNLSPDVTCKNDPGGNGATQGAEEFITVVVQPNIIEF